MSVKSRHQWKQEKIILFIYYKIYKLQADQMALDQKSSKQCKKQQFTESLIKSVFVNCYFYLPL